MLFMERLDCPVQCINTGVYSDLKRPPLPLVAHRNATFKLGVSLINTFVAEPLCRIRLQLLVLTFQIIDVSFMSRGSMHDRQVMLNIDQQAAQRRGDPGARGYDDGRDAQLFSHFCSMQSPGASECHQCEVSWV